MWIVLLLICVAVVIFCGYSLIKQSKEKQETIEDEHRRPPEDSQQTQQRNNSIQNHRIDTPKPVKKITPNDYDRFEEILNLLPKAEIKPDVHALKLKRNTLSEMPEIKFAGITKSTNLEKIKNFIVLNIETTGISVRGNRIIEFSAIRFEDFYPVMCYTTLINPKMSIPDEAMRINHITNEMVSGKPGFYQLVKDILDFVGAFPIVGHNIEFDLKHLWVSGLDLITSRKIFDTLDIAKKTLKRLDDYKLEKSLETGRDYDWDVDDYKLDTLCEYYGVYRNSSHRALSDCLATGYLFVSLIDDRTEDFQYKKLEQEILKNCKV